MTLDAIVPQRLAEWRPPEGRQELTLADPASGWSVALTADRRDELGCLVWELAVRRPDPRADGLHAWAGRIARQVTGLLEPLRVWEVDPLRNEGQLRSDKPLHRGDRVLYFEVFLKGTTEAVLRRFEAAENGHGKRQQVAFALTHEGLGKLAKDLTS